MNLSFAAIDFETATSNYTSVCSLGICVVENNKITDRKEILIKPEPFEFNDYNIKIHGITPDMVVNKPTLADYWAKLKPYLDHKTVIAHNASFDVGFLKHNAKLLGYEFNNTYIDTLPLAKDLFPDLKKYKLGKIADSLGIEVDVAHRALADVDTTVKVFDQMEKGEIQGRKVVDFTK